MLTATLLALGSAVMHAGWNLTVKTAGDRFSALWGQFFVGGLLCLGPLLLLGGVPAKAWIWAVLSGVVHIPYVVYLSRAYDAGEFSAVYPVARGGGAALAAVGGILLLGDSLSWLGLVAIGVIVAGLVALAGGAHRTSILHALAVALTIGIYSVSDAHGIRSTGSGNYALSTFVAGGTVITVYGVAVGRRAQMTAAMSANWRRYVLTALAVVTTYTMVQFAYERAAVGYVSALRESSVVLAALIGWRFLGEQGGRRRLVCALVVLTGLVLLVIAR